MLVHIWLLNILWIDNWEDYKWLAYLGFGHTRAYSDARTPVEKLFTDILAFNPGEEEESDLHNDVVTFYGVSAAIVHFWISEVPWPLQK